MKIATIIIRILLGLIFAMSSIVYFLHLFPQPELKGALKIFNEGMAASVYLLPFVKGTEFVCAVAFLSGRYVTLASVIIFPVILNIILVHSFLAPEGLPVAIFLLLSVLFLAYTNRKNYVTLFVAK